MPKGLYCNAVFFSVFFLSSFFRRLISVVTERISTKLRHTFTYDCYLKNVVLSHPGVYHPRAWGKTCVFGTDFKLWPKISLQSNIISTIGKKLVNLQRFQPPNLVNFSPQTDKNNGRVSAHPLKFAGRTSCTLTLFCETFRFNHIRQMAHMVDADAKSLFIYIALVRRRSGQAHAGLCHVSIKCIVLEATNSYLADTARDPPSPFCLFTKKFV